MFMYLQKNKKGFTLIELMVVVAIIGILALLGLRLYLAQQARAKNAIAKANAATVHTIIQGNLADRSYPLGDTNTADVDAVNDIREDDGETLLTEGIGYNSQRPSGMKNPHLTGETTDDDDVVVQAIGTADSASALETSYSGSDTLNDEDGGSVVVAVDTNTANKFYIVALDQYGNAIQDVYTAQK